MLEFFAAPLELRPWVLGVSVWSVGLDAADIDQTLLIPGHAMATIGLVLSGQLALESGRRLRPGEWLSSGPCMHPSRFVAVPGTTVASVLLRAAVLRRLTGRSACSFLNQDQLPLEAILSESCGTAMAYALAKWGACDGRGAIDDVWTSVVAWQEAWMPADERALRFVEDMANWDWRALTPVGWKERSWQRACRYETGLTPKQLQRLFRLNQSAAVLAGGVPEVVHPISQSEHALEHGFFDQSHCLREYRDLAGALPGRSKTATDRERALQLGANQLVPLMRSVTDLSKTRG